MDMAKIVVLGITGAFLSLILKENKQFTGIAISILTAITVFFLVLNDFEEIISFLKRMFISIGGRDAHIDTVLKIVGITCMTHLGEGILKEAGLSAAAFSVTLAGRIICIGMCVPIVAVLFNTILSVIPN